MPPSELAPYIESLRDYYSQHRSIPSLAGLADLWGYRAKSWAAEIVANLKRHGILEPAPGRRLRPGPRFPAPVKAVHGTDHRRELATPPEDPIDAAAQAWAAEVPDSAAEAYALVVRLAAVSDLMEREFQDEARSIGLSAGEVMVLDALRRLGPPYESSAARLKDLFLISFAGIGKRVQRLERLGYIVKSINPRDRRSQTVRLTASGLALLRKRFRKRYAKHIRALMDLSSGERRHLAETLRRLQQRIEVNGAERADSLKRLRANHFTE